MPIDPRGMAIEHWSALTAASMLPYGDVPRSTTEANWPSWATAVKNVPALSARNVPSPKGYADWQSWAFRLNEALRSIGA